MSEDARRAAIALHDRFTHEGMDRRVFMAELTRIAGGAAAAAALLAAIAADPAAAQVIAADDDDRIRTRDFSWRAAGAGMKGYVAEPAKGRGPLPAVIVIHENRGLNAHIRDVARRLAVAGFRALAPDFLSASGGTPGDEAAAREAIGKLDLSQSARQGVGTIAMLKALPRSNSHVGCVGFCWGGGMVNRLAVSAGATLDAAVSFYGPAPDPALAARVAAPMLLHFAGLDERVNATGLPWAEALKAAGKDATSIVYPNVNHAFHNDTSAERYDSVAAHRAWDDTITFLRKHLA